MNVTLFRDLPTEHWWSMERYADELATALRALSVSVREYAPRRPWPHLRGSANAILNYAWRLSVYPVLARTEQGDVNHILDHSYAHLLDALDPRHTVVTCHDIAPLVLSQGGRGLSRRLWEIAFNALPRAAHVACDSTYTRTELQRHTTIPLARLSVIPLGVRDFGAIPRSAASQAATVLHVGSCQPRKNLPVLLRALAQVPQARLVQVGGQPNSEHLALIEHLGLSTRVQFVGAVGEVDLHRWYCEASVLVLPSHYEGFGLPVLEAMVAGLPVICSNATSLPEVAGDAALLFDPNDADTLVAHLEAVLGDPTLRSRLINAGRRRSSEFTWEKTARATLAVYQQI